MQKRSIDINFLPWQKEVFRSTATFKGAICSRGVGKTEFLITSACLDMVQGKRLVYWCPTLGLLEKEIMPRMMNKLYDWGFQPKYNKQKHTITLDLKNEWTHKIFGASYENVDAFTGTDKVATAVFDEATLARDWESVIRACIPAMRNSGYDPVDLFGCTPRPHCEFSKWLKSHNDVFVKRGITVWDNPHISEKELDNMVKMFKGTPLERQELYGEELEDLEFAVFPSLLFNVERKHSNGFRSLGVDCAGSGRDNNSFIVSDDSGICEKVKIQVADTFQLANIARQLIEKWDVRLVNIDGTGGFGNGLYDMLKTQYDFVHLVNFGQGANDADHYANARAEMFYTLRRDMEGGFCVDDPEIREEMEIISFIINVSGKTQLIPKETIKKVIGRSPDCADALALSRYNRDNPSVMVKPIDVNTSELVASLSGW